MMKYSTPYSHVVTVPTFRRAEAILTSDNKNVSIIQNPVDRTPIQREWHRLATLRNETHTYLIEGEANTNQAYNPQQFEKSLLNRGLNPLTIPFSLTLFHAVNRWLFSTEDLNGLCFDFDILSNRRGGFHADAVYVVAAIYCLYVNPEFQFLYDHDGSTLVADENHFRQFGFYPNHEDTPHQDIMPHARSTGINNLPFFKGYKFNQFFGLSLNEQDNQAALHGSPIPRKRYTQNKAQRTIAFWGLRLKS